MGGYSAACRDRLLADFANAEKASATRSSKPGLSGEKGVSSSFGAPSLSAAAKIFLRLTRNLAASRGSAKSATRTDHLVSYAVHSGDSSSGFPNSGSCFAFIRPLLSLVCLSEGYKSCPFAAQNKYDDVQAVAEITAGDHAILAVVFPIIGVHARRGPVEEANLIKGNAVLPLIDRILLIIPFKVHDFAVHLSGAMAAMIFAPHHWPNARTFCEENQ